MDRREALKTLAIGTLSTGWVVEAWNPKSEGTGGTIMKSNSTKNGINAPWAGKYEKWEESSGRQPFEINRDKRLISEKFFNDHEMKTLGVLADIIIPKDDKSGSATDAGVPGFIEFIVKDKPHFQTPMLGGLHWIDRQCRGRYNKTFVNCNKKQQVKLVDKIAWPEKAKPELSQGVTFFRGLCRTP